MKLMFGSTVSGPETGRFTAIRFPPITDIQISDSYTSLNLSHLDLDWNFFYGFTSTKTKDTIIEVRQQSASLFQTSQHSKRIFLAEPKMNKITQN